jgi:hypothetical protein
MCFCYLLSYEASEAQVKELQGELRQSAEEVAALRSRLQEQETAKILQKSMSQYICAVKSIHTDFSEFPGQVAGCAAA